VQVSLFVTCLVEQISPQVGVATVELLRRHGVRVVYNAEQTCCGQPAYNTGFRREAREVARGTLRLLERELEASDYVVLPSGSCTAMVRRCYPQLFADDAAERERAERIAGRVMELSQFLVGVLGVESTGAAVESAGAAVESMRGGAGGRVTYHDSCHLLRELGVADEPRKLLAAVRGAEFVEMERADVCCGFGGTFSVKFPELAASMAEEKLASIERTGADTVVACDAGCLMHLAGLISRRRSPVRCLHIAEFLNARPEADDTRN
jgi:L-lactate dehydrogenase complex protein LldE